MGRSGEHINSPYCFSCRNERPLGSNCCRKFADRYSKASAKSCKKLTRMIMRQRFSYLQYELALIKHMYTTQHRLEYFQLPTMLKCLNKDILYVYNVEKKFNANLANLRIFVTILRNIHGCMIFTNCERINKITKKINIAKQVSTCFQSTREIFLLQSGFSRYS